MESNGQMVGGDTVEGPTLRRAVVAAAVGGAGAGSGGVVVVVGHVLDLVFGL